MPSSETLYPIQNITKGFIFLKNFITNPNIQVGDFTYYHSKAQPEKFEKENVIMPLTCKLIIGKFCQIAEGTKFIMGDANHDMSGFSTYPFYYFGDDWAKYAPSLSRKGDTIIGNDVWMAQGSVIMPGVNIGDGAIIGAYALVTKDVPPYTIVGGNPAKMIRKRFEDSVIEQLLKIQWWNWDYEKISRNVSKIADANIKALLDAT